MEIGRLILNYINFNVIKLNMKLGFLSGIMIKERKGAKINLKGNFRLNFLIY